MAAKVDLTGRRFGKLVVASFWDNAKRSRRSHRRWKCHCDCGNIKIVVGQDLTTGRTSSCGCSRKRFTDVPLRQLYQRYKHQAKQRQLVFDLSEKLFRELVTRNCYYCDMPPALLSIYKHTGEFCLYNGIDRKDNAIGYVESNVLSCCDLCNKAKRDLSYQDFISWLDRIVRHRS